MIAENSCPAIAKIHTMPSSSDVISLLSVVAAFWIGSYRLHHQVDHANESARLFRAADSETVCQRSSSQRGLSPHRKCCAIRVWKPFFFLNHKFWIDLQTNLKGSKVGWFEVLQTQRKSSSIVRFSKNSSLHKCHRLYLFAYGLRQSKILQSSSQIPIQALRVRFRATAKSHIGKLSVVRLQ